VVCAVSVVGYGEEGRGCWFWFVRVCAGVAWYGGCSGNAVFIVTAMLRWDIQALISRVWWMPEFRRGRIGVGKVQ